MKNPTVSFAILWFVFRLALHFTDFFDNDFSVSVMINMLFMVIIIYNAVKEESSRTTDFLEVAKAGMREVSKYAFLVALLMFAFYQFIGNDFITDTIDTYHLMQKEQIVEQGGWDEVSAEDPALKGKTQEQFFEEQTAQASKLITPWFITSFSLFAMVIGGVLYSLISTFFFRQMMRSVKR